MNWLNGITGPHRKRGWWLTLPWAAARWGSGSPTAGNPPRPPTDPSTSHVQKHASVHAKVLQAKRMANPWSPRPMRCNITTPTTLQRCVIVSCSAKSTVGYGSETTGNYSCKRPPVKDPQQVLTHLPLCLGIRCKHVVSMRKIKQLQPKSESLFECRHRRVETAHARSEHRVILCQNKHFDK